MRPLIVVCGTTGVGKSKLAVELATRLRSSHDNLRPGRSQWKGARIINADAMQVYEGLDILTNKMPKEERKCIEHLLIDIKKPGEQYVVGEWVQDAIKAIDETHGRSQIPIVVGGTSYWIQHLIFPERLMSSFESHLVDEDTPAAVSSKLQKLVAGLPPELLDLFSSLPENPPSASVHVDSALSLHRLLSLLDPVVAERWHWRDTRKVLRSLSIIRETGRLPSEIISKQSAIPVSPRYRTLCLWLYAEPSVLNDRLDARVDEMMKLGLLNEIQHLKDIAHKDDPAFSTSTDYSLGLYQSIGYKEWNAYLESEDELKTVFDNALNNMKVSTRRYAKRQVSWIRNKLLPAIYAINGDRVAGDVQVPVFLLDATALDAEWEAEVLDRAVEITRDFLANNPLPDAVSLSERARVMLDIKEKTVDPAGVLVARRKTICPVCTVDNNRPVMIEDQELQAHSRTRLHRRLLRKQRQAEDMRNVDKVDKTSAPFI